jgi:[acyl-carrier-protein] S-malonyltransferase
MQKFAIVFPGQGSQKVGMLADVFEKFPLAKKLFTQASDILGYDLFKIVAEGPEETLNQTVYTQPALLVADMVMWEFWKQNSEQRPGILAGHSLGEYAALVAAEVLSFNDAVSLVSKRAQFMQEAVPEGVGAMAAIVMLSGDKVREICESISTANKFVTIANLNEQQQTVIAGHAAAVDKAVLLAKAAGSKLAKRLPVSVPSHCALMKPAAQKLKICLDQIEVRSPKIPVINNVDVAEAFDPIVIRDALVRQVYMPVRWYEIIEKMKNAGFNKVIECGPGKVLTGQNRRICPELEVVSFNSIECIS